MNKKELLLLLHDESYLRTVEGVAKALQLLTQLEESGRTSYTGSDLNTLERIQNKIEDETISKKDILEVEKLAFKFL